MREFIDKLIARLEEKKSEHLHDEEVTQGLGKINLASFCSAKARALDGAIEIVNQLAEEMGVAKNATTTWIPCSERLPEVNGWYLVTNELGVVQQQYWGASHWQKLRDDSVIAWCELPQPYQPKGE